MPPLQPKFTTQMYQTFLHPTEHYVVHALIKSAPLPQPRLHTTRQQYAALLDKAEHAGMLYWDIASPGEPVLQSAMEMTLFANSKNATRSRLISWPRIPNAAIPDPPHTSLPDPSLFDSISTQGGTLSAFYIDIQNMFHNITLPPSMARLFPMRPLPLSDLQPATRLRIKSRLVLQDHPEHVLIRPYQATMPMGFKWSVYIAHTFAQSCLREAYHLFRSSRFAPPGLAAYQIFQSESVPFHITSIAPLLLHIIDDIAAVVINWPDEAVRAWHRITRSIFRLNLLPIGEPKSCLPHHVERDKLPFIGCTWSLQGHTITPDPAKFTKVYSQISALMDAQTITTSQWKRIIGRLVWLSLLNRPLFFCTRAVFTVREDTTNSPQQHIIPCNNKQEVLMLTTLLPLAFVRTNMPIFTTILASDASVQAGAVTYVRVTPTLARRLWSHAKHRQFHPPDSVIQPNELITIVSRLPWTKAFAHQWISAEHINGLEASAAVLALEWAIRSGARNTNLLMFTDSMVVRGALLKGRSSSPALSLRCRRLTALALAQNIRLAIDYIPSKLNPADVHTRAGLSTDDSQ